MKRRLAGAVSILCVSVAIVFLFAPSPSAVSNWEMGDLSAVAQCLGVEPTAGVYNISEILCSLAERVGCTCEAECFVDFANVVDVYRGNTATLTVHTTPGASCTIRVVLPSGSTSGASGLGQKTADSTGMVSWSWLVGGNTGPGTGTIYVTATTPDGSQCVEWMKWEVRKH